MSHPPSPARRVPARRLVVAAGILLVVDLGLWSGHVVWRGRAERSLAPLASQLDSLELRLAEDEEWIERNARLMEGYAQHTEYAERLVLRGRRAAAHRVLAEEHDRRLRQIYRRFYLAPLPAPPPPLRARPEP